jgi:N-terminal domain of reverse transcriptase
MTADTAEAGHTAHHPAAGAPARAQGGWHAIDWPAAHHNVRRLQARIVQATQEGRGGKVKALQPLLPHSFSGKAIAVKRVTENQGQHPPGVDRDIWNTPAKKMEAGLDLRQRGDRPRPLRRGLIPKRNGKMRPLGIPTMRDRAMQALYLLALAPSAETTADPKLLRIQQGTIHRRCDDAVLYHPCPQGLGAMGLGRRQHGLLREEPPRLAAHPGPNGQGGASEVVASRGHGEADIAPTGGGYATRRYRLPGPGQPRA